MAGADGEQGSTTASSDHSKNDAAVGHAAKGQPYAHGQHHQPKGGLFPNACLLLAVTLLAASNSVLAWMLQKGEPYFTTCNILCVSNLIAVVTSWPMFWQDLKWKKVRALRARDWAAILVASLARNVGGAYLEVAGLSMTNVPTFAIVEMLESVEFFLLALCFLRHERRNGWIIGNNALIVLGVLVALFEPAMERGLAEAGPKGKGVAFLAGSGVNFAVAELIGHLFLERIPLGIYAMGRVLLGTLFFHLLAWAEGAESEEGTSALENIYSAELWAQMAWYGFLFITVTQYAWLTALKRCRPAVISRGTSFMFILNLLFAAAIMRQTPTTSQYIGSAFIVLSIGSGLLEAHRNEAPEEDEAAEDGGLEMGVAQRGEGGDDEEGVKPISAAQEHILGQRI